MSNDTSARWPRISTRTPKNLDDKSLNNTDLHGVTLAAIQGLNQKPEQKETKIAELKNRLAKLEQFLNLSAK